MANYKNSKIESTTTKRTVPSSLAGTGTFATSGTTITGSGTSFTTELKPGAWIPSLTQNELRQVASIKNDTTAYLINGFSVDIAAGTALTYISKEDAEVSEISILIPAGNAAGVVDGVAFPAGIPLTFSKADKDRTGKGDFVDPIIVDGSSTTMLISTLK